MTKSREVYYITIQLYSVNFPTKLRETRIFHSKSTGGLTFVLRYLSPEREIYIQTDRQTEIVPANDFIRMILMSVVLVLQMLLS